MDKNKFEYRQDTAFINRENELQDLKNFVDKKPSEILFIHGTKSSGKTTLLYKFPESPGGELSLRNKIIFRKYLRQETKNIRFYLLAPYLEYR